MKRFALVWPGFLDRSFYGRCAASALCALIVILSCSIARRTTPILCVMMISECRPHGRARSIVTCAGTGAVLPAIAPSVSSAQAYFRSHQYLDRRGAFCHQMTDKESTPIVLALAASPERSAFVRAFPFCCQLYSRYTTLAIWRGSISSCIAT